MPFNTSFLQPREEPTASRDQDNGTLVHEPISTVSALYFKRFKTKHTTTSTLHVPVDILLLLLHARLQVQPLALQPLHLAQRLPVLGASLVLSVVLWQRGIASLTCIAPCTALIARRAADSVTFSR